MDGTTRNRISRRAACQSLAAGVSLLFTGGCINVAAIAGKMFIGDPKSNSKVKDISGVDLEEAGHRVILTCQAPLSVMEGYESAASDLEVELLRRMRQKKIPTVDSDEVVELLDARGGQYNPQILIDEIPDADLLFELRMESFTLKDLNTPQMYHGQCAGRIIGFQIIGGEEHGKAPGSRMMSQFFENDFDIDYPNGYPIPRENMSEMIFRKKFIGFLGQRLGNIFFDVTSQELYS
ncbi:MAG: hypothetical protein DWH91_07400 [Planctomycetota bacterium]|nr:MAG: hypothetical protein DWH91_07400 [Planctomycetota bacterium]